MATEPSFTLTAEKAGRVAREEAAAQAVSRAPSAVRSVVLQAALVWLGTRLALAFFTYFSVIVDNPAVRTGTLSRGLQYPGQLIAAWEQWDVAGLLSVARNGYSDRLFTVWFPLEPLLTRGVATLLGQVDKPVGPHISLGWVVSGLVVSNLALLGAFVGLAVLTYRETRSRTAAWLAPVVFSAYPFAFFLSAPYADSLFLALAVGALLAARQRLWVLAALAAYLAALTRNTAIILVAPLVWEYGRVQGWWTLDHWRRLRDVRPVLRRLPGLVGVTIAVPAGIGTYMAYLWVTKGSPTLFVTAERVTWARELTAPWWTLGEAFKRLAQQGPWSYWQLLLGIDLATLLLAALATALLARRQPFSFSLYMVGLLLLSLLYPPVGPGWPDVLTGSARYVALSFPVFIGLAQVIDRRPALGAAVLGTGLMMEAALASFYLTGGWLG